MSVAGLSDSLLLAVIVPPASREEASPFGPHLVREGSENDPK